MVRIMNISLLATLSVSLLPLTSAMPTAGKPPSFDHDSLWPILKDLHPRLNPNTRLRNRASDLEFCADSSACEVLSKSQSFCQEQSTAAGSKITWMECMCNVEKTEYQNLWDDIEYCVSCIQAQDPSYDVSTMFGIDGDLSTGARAQCDKLGISSSGSSTSTETDSDTNTDADADADTDTDTPNTRNDTKTGSSTKKNGGNALVRSGYTLIPVMVGALGFAL